MMLLYAHGPKENMGVPYVSIILFYFKCCFDYCRSLDPLSFPMDIKLLDLMCCRMSEEVSFCFCENSHVWKVQQYGLDCVIKFIMFFFRDVDVCFV